MQGQSHMVSWCRLVARCCRQWEEDAIAPVEPLHDPLQLRDSDNPTSCSLRSNRPYWTTTPTLRSFTRNSRHPYLTPMGQPKPTLRPRSADWCLRCDNRLL